MLTILLLAATFNAHHPGHDRHSEVPEPATIILIGAGMAGVALLRKKGSGRKE